jgi:antirestriction protein ArdC
MAFAATKRYVTGYWASYQQWRKLGAQVRGGERGSLIIFYKDLEDDPENQTGTDGDRPRFVIRSSHVFNAEQVDGWEFPQNPRASQVEIDEQIEGFVRATKADTGRSWRRGGLTLQGTWNTRPHNAQAPTVSRALAAPGIRTAAHR